MRSIALDVHRDFCEVAIKDQSGCGWPGGVKTKPEDLEFFARSLAPDDQVALEASEPGALSEGRRRLVTRDRLPRIWSLRCARLAGCRSARMRCAQSSRRHLVRDGH
jgi:hypothetical protein